MDTIYFIENFGSFNQKISGKTDFYRNFFLIYKYYRLFIILSEKKSIGNISTIYILDQK